jgi:membrane protein required for colicin V production
VNSLDITILLIMAVSLTLSTFRGGVREIFSLAAVIVGFILASRLYHKTSAGILRVTSYPDVNNVISFLLIFFFTAVLISFIGGRLSEVAKTKAKLMNILLGTAIGAVKGILVSSLVVYAALVFLPQDSRVFTMSKTFPYVSRVVEVISPIGPAFFREEFGKKLAEIRAKKAPEKEKAPEKKPAEKKPGKP